MDYSEVLKEISLEILPLFKKGNVADYIPALANVDPHKFSMSLQFFDDKSSHIGEYGEKFSIQSISKLFSFVHVVRFHKDDLMGRLGLEPSGNPFNSLVQLEYENGIPRNPFINAGAIVVADILISHYGQNGFTEVIKKIQKRADLSITFDSAVYNSEKENGFRNYSMINMMKSFGNINNDINLVMDLYFKLCSIRMSTQDLCRATLFLANHGIDPIDKTKILTLSQSKRVNALMLTCGHYDASGDFAFRVGIPAKSGVGGGIVAIIPSVMSLCVYSPRLNSKGNSLIGTKALELFTTKTGLSIF